MASHFLSLVTSATTTFPLAANPNIFSLLNSNSMSWPALYITGTLIIAALICYESISLKRHHGKLPATKLLQIASILEIVWLPISAAVLYYGNLLPVIKTIPVAYIGYSIFGWLYGFYLLKEEDLDVDNVEDIEMPMQYMDYTLAFAIVMMLTCLAFLGYLWFLGEFQLPLV